MNSKTEVEGIRKFLVSGSEVVPDANSQIRQLLGKDLFEKPTVLPE